MKTGSTQASGYGLVGSALRGDKRRIIVVNGLTSKAERRDVSLRLMAAAFDQFKVYSLYKRGDEIGEVDVYMGKADTVKVVIDEDVTAGIHRNERKNIRSELVYKAAPAPISTGDHLADMVVRVPGRDDKIIKLYAAQDVKSKSIFGKAWSVLLQKIRG